MEAYQGNIVFGGYFNAVGSSNRLNVAVVDPNTSLATSWDAKLLSSGGVDYVVSLNVHSNLLYVGGAFANIGGQPRWFAAALDLTNGNATPWNPKCNMQVAAFSGSGNTMYMGGVFSAVGCIGRTNLAAFDLVSNQITSWAPEVGTRSGTPVNAMLIASNQVFIGGFFTNVSGQIRSNLAALDLPTGTVLDWAPNPSGTIFALATWNDRLFVGGGFTNINGLSQTNFAEFYLNDLSVTPWDPSIRSLVQALCVNGDTLYAGGSFTIASGQSRRRVAAFDLSSDILTSWNPNITNGSAVYAIATSGSQVYLGGIFNVVNGFNRTNFVAVDAVTAQVLPLVANADSFVYGLAANSNFVFIAGNFGQVNGQSRPALASLDINSNALTAWNPKADFYGKTCAIFDNVLYAAGLFLHAGGVNRSLAAFPLSLVGRPSIVSNSMQRLGNGDIQFRITASGVSQATILVSTNLNTWQSLQTVPLTGSYGVFTDANALNYPRRFYRLSVP